MSCFSLCFFFRSISSVLLQRRYSHLPPSVKLSFSALFSLIQCSGNPHVTCLNVSWSVAQELLNHCSADGRGRRKNRDHCALYRLWVDHLLNRYATIPFSVVKYVCARIVREKNPCQTLNPSFPCISTPTFTHHVVGISTKFPEVLDVDNDSKDKDITMSTSGSCGFIFMLMNIGSFINKCSFPVLSGFSFNWPVIQTSSRSWFKKCTRCQFPASREGDLVKWTKISVVTWLSNSLANLQRRLASKASRELRSATKVRSDFRRAVSVRINGCWQEILRDWRTFEKCGFKQTGVEKWKSFSARKVRAKIPTLRRNYF